MKIFITGITGFAGSMLANRFVQHGFEVTGLGRKETLPSHVDKRCVYVREDISKPINKIQADIVIHAAAQVDDGATYENHYLNNVVGTTNVINACKGIKLFILISTSSVYSFKSNMPYVEAEGGEDFDNLSHYGKTKFLSERELLKANNIKSKIILRPRAIYGAGDSVLLPRLLCLVKKNKIILPSNTTGQISLTHINNLLDAVELCLKFSENHSGIYNISDDKIYSLKEAIPALIRSVTDRPLKIFLVPKQLWNLLVRFNAIFHFIPQLTTFGSKQLTQTALLNVELAKKELGYSSSNSFYESLEGTGIWYRNK